jgi:predicted acylesterase/phospholipase RssA
MDKRPTIGLAFSGASSRSIFYIGFLEVLQENEFPIDYISAMSGAAIVAASFACGSLGELKRTAINLDREFLFKIIERSKGKGGLYSLEKMESIFRVYTRNLRFEDVSPRLGFVATDITDGEEVVLQVGDIARAVCASCTLPGIFQPIEWGRKQLVDGGVVNVIPGNVARAAEVDLVIGVDMRNTRHVFSGWQIQLKLFIDKVRQWLWPSPIDSLWHKLAGLLNYSDAYNLRASSDYPNIFTVLDKSIGLAIKAQKNEQDSNFGCDMLIVPEITTMPFWKRYSFMHFMDFSKTREYYLAGRQTARQHLPQMWQLVAEKQKDLEKVNKTVENILKK